ncbi:hypothetical protein C8R11_11939 [Nitrosomonas aestuarii]|nr:hypothetical protein C8R11_11939 [Nitrosomonas aestuarii]
MSETHEITTGLFHAEGVKLNILIKNDMNV